MVPVRTNLRALLTSGALIGAVAVAAARHGLLIDGPRVWTIDSAILLGLKAGSLYVLGFAILHVVAQRLTMGLRSVYAGLGAVATVATMLLLANRGQIDAFVDKGYLLATLIALGAFGALVGFLYHVRAGYVSEGDNPGALGGFLRGLQTSGTDDRGDTAMPASISGVKGQASEDRAHIQLETAEYFDGPLQVRTSFGTMVVSALAGTLLFNFGVMFMSLASWLTQQSAPHASHPGDIAAAVRNFNPLTGVSGLDGVLSFFANSAAGGLLFGLLLAIPFAAVIYACHGIARALNKTSYLAYAAIGLVAPPILGLLLFFVFFFVGLKMAFPCAIAMLIYRNLAGLEPKPVAEDILVGDRRHLVGSGHARRRYGRVIATR